MARPGRRSSERRHNLLRVGVALLGLAQSALVLLGIGIVSSRFKAGVGLGELGTGIQTLVAAPLTGTGTGLSSFAGGLTDLAVSLGDIGRGFGELFKNIPQLPPPREGPPRHGTSNGNGVVDPPQIWFAARPLIPDSGGSASTLLAGGGGNSPSGTLPPPAPIGVQVPPRMRASFRPIAIGPAGGSKVMML